MGNEQADSLAMTALVAETIVRDKRKIIQKIYEFILVQWNH